MVDEMSAIESPIPSAFCSSEGANLGSDNTAEIPLSISQVSCMQKNMGICNMQRWQA